MTLPTVRVSSWCGIVSLETLRAIRGNPKVRIYSGEHFTWWRKDGAGYATHVGEAGTWSLEDAFAATRHCGPEKQIEFEVVEST